MKRAVARSRRVSLRKELTQCLLSVVSHTTSLTQFGQVNLVFCVWKVGNALRKKTKANKKKEEKGVFIKKGGKEIRVRG